VSVSCGCRYYSMFLLRVPSLSRLVVGVVALTLASPVIRAQTGDVKLPTPVGLSVCPDNDPVIAGEKRVAPSVGAEYLACFVSHDQTPVRGTSKTVSIAAEHAIAMSMSGGPFTHNDLEAQLARARASWRNFKQW